MRERRLIRVSIASQFLFDFLTEGYENYRGIRIIRGIPKDAAYVGSVFDDQRMIAHLIFEHPDFDIVEDWQPIPIRDVIVKHSFHPEAERLLKEMMDGDIEK